MAEIKDPENTIVMETTKGNVTIELYPDPAPGHVARIKELARAGAYDGVVFHRVIPGFMVQGGCPRGDGTGDPGYSINELREMYPDFFWEKGGGAWYQQEDFANLKEKPCMRTILAELLEGSLNKTWKEQQKLIPEDCEIPLARQVMIMCLLHFLKTGEYLLKDVYVRCRDLSSDGSLLRFGIGLRRRNQPLGCRPPRFQCLRHFGSGRLGQAGCPEALGSLGVRGLGRRKAIQGSIGSRVDGIDSPGAHLASGEAPCSRPALLRHPHPAFLSHRRTTAGVGVVAFPAPNRANK